jgi:hypothetical protein
MRIRLYIMAILTVLFPGNLAFAGNFYKIVPHWLEYAYHILLILLIFLAFLFCFSIFKTLRDGKLGKPWLLFLLAFASMFARTILGILTVFNIAYFKALVFAGLDILFFVFFLIGLIIYKLGLD